MPRSSLILTVAGACLLWASAPAHAQIDIKAAVVIPAEYEF